MTYLHIILQCFLRYSHFVLPVIVISQQPEMVGSIAGLFNAVRMIHSVSHYYNSSERMSALLIKVSRPAQRPVCRWSELERQGQKIKVRRSRSEGQGQKVKVKMKARVHGECNRWDMKLIFAIFRYFVLGIKYYATANYGFLAILFFFSNKNRSRSTTLISFFHSIPSLQAFFVVLLIF